MLSRFSASGPVLVTITRLLAYQAWPAGQPPARTEAADFQANGRRRT
jgi:hypothetical protein